MKIKIGALLLAALVLVPTSRAAPPVTASTNAPAEPQWDVTITEAHRQALDDLTSKRRDYKAGKCKIVDVYQASDVLRAADLAMSNTKEQQVAAYTRHAAFLRDLEGDATTEKDKSGIQKMCERADATLLHVKSLEMTAADLERDQHLWRSVALTNQRWAKEMHARRIRRSVIKNPRESLIFPTRPPRYVDRSPLIIEGNPR